MKFLLEITKSGCPSNLLTHGVAEHTCLSMLVRGRNSRTSSQSSEPPLDDPDCHFDYSIEWHRVQV